MGLLLCASAQAQLSNQDDCANGEVDTIAGDGSWAFDLAAATTGTQGQAEANCDFFGEIGIENDIWITWVPDVTGSARIETCVNTATDTKLAIYPGGSCPPDGSSLACNDDDCGLQSGIDLPVQLGECYLIQLGNFPGAATAGGSGELTITTTPAPPAAVVGQDDCATAGSDVQVGPGLFTIDKTGATTGAEGQNEGTCYAFGTSGIDNDVWFTYFATATGTTTIDTCASAAGDSKLAAYPGGDCPGDGTSLACNDDDCGTLSTISFPSVAGESYLVQLGNFPGGSGDIFDVTISEAGGSGNLGANYCPNNPNSTGVAGTVAALGSTSEVDNALFVQASNLPCGEFGYFLSSPGMGVIPTPGNSSGNFCLGGSPGLVGRYKPQTGNSGSSGTITIRLDLNAIPTAANNGATVVLMAGDTWNWQLWYRNNGGNNFTDATSVTITP